MHILNRYEVVKILGAGSMGAVYLCRHRELSGRLFAVKLLSKDALAHPGVAKHFRDRALASYSVTHPNLIQIYEYFQDEDVVGLSMEYLEGGSLADLLLNDISMPEVTRILIGICSGVQAVHDVGMIYKNLKPESVLFTKGREVKLAGFGTTVFINHGLNEHGGVSASINYVTPEYMTSGKEDKVGDIYRIGLLGYEMITGEYPFSGHTVHETISKRLNEELDSPQLHRSDCPESLAQVIQKAASREVSARYQSASEMRQALESIRFS